MVGFAQNLHGIVICPYHPLPRKFLPAQPPIDELALAEIKSAILAKLTLAIGKEAARATRHDWYKAAALALRDRIVHHWLMPKRTATTPAASASITCRWNS